VILIDEFTGRMMQGRRLSEGLHQAIEAKEGAQRPAREPDPGLGHHPELLPPLQEAVGHDRHGATEAQEFLDIYKMDVMEIPTNRPVARIDDDDEVYRTEAEKNLAILGPDRGMPSSCAASRSWSAPSPSRSRRPCRSC
jgi:preprotein translocase subunit SecA